MCRKKMEYGVAGGGAGEWMAVGVPCTIFMLHVVQGRGLGEWQSEPKKVFSCRFFFLHLKVILLR